MLFRGRKDKEHVLRRLFKSLEKRVERSYGKHMYLVDDVHALFHECGGVCDLIADIADVVNTRIRCRVHLHNVRSGAIVNGQAFEALAARVAVYRLVAVDSLGKDLGAGSFTCTSGTAEKVGMRKASSLRLIFQNGGNMILTVHIVKAAGAVFSVQRHMFQKITPLYANKK